MSKSESKGELANSQSMQVNPSVVAARVGRSLESVKADIEAEEDAMVALVLDQVLPEYLSNLASTSSDRIGRIVDKKIGERVGQHLQNFQSQWNSVSADIVQDLRANVIPGLLAG